MAVTPTTTLGDLVNKINAVFPGSTASIDAAGNLSLQANATGPAAGLNLTLSDANGNAGASKWTNHALTPTTVGTNGDTLSTAIQFFDTQGTAHTLTMQFQKTATNNWNLTGSIPPADGTTTSGQVTGITFNDNGSFRQVAGTGSATATMTFQINGLAVPQTIVMNLGASGGFNGLTQFGGTSSANAVGQDGFGAGNLASVSSTRPASSTACSRTVKSCPSRSLRLRPSQTPRGSIAKVVITSARVPVPRYR